MNKKGEAENFHISDSLGSDLNIVDRNSTSFQHLKEYSGDESSVYECSLTLPKVVDLIQNNSDTELIRDEINDTELYQALPFIKKGTFWGKRGSSWRFETPREDSRLVYQIIQIPIEDSVTFTPKAHVKAKKEMKIDELVLFKTGFMVMKCSHSMVFILISDCGSRKLLETIIDLLILEGLKRNQDFYKIACGGTLH